MSDRLQRLFAIALFGAAVALLVLLGVLPLSGTYLERNALIEERAELVARFERLAGREESVRAAVQAARRDAVVERVTYDQATGALAAASLQDRIKTVISQVGGALVSTRVQPEIEEGVFTRIAVEAQVKLDLAQLQQALHTLESGAPAVFIDRLVVQLVAGARRDGSAEEAPPLDVQFEAAGYLRGTPSPAQGS